MAYAETGQARNAVGSMDASARGNFLVKTYLHLLGAMILFVVIEAAMFQTDAGMNMIASIAGNWYLVFGAFILVSWIGSHVAHTAESKGIQYMALLGVVAMEAVIFAPLIYMAMAQTGDTSLLQNAALMTLLAFSVLSAIVFMTGKDFSFLRSFLMYAFIIALVTIIAAIVFNLALGIWFSAAMVLLAGGAILYDTSNVLHHYPEDRYVGASLELFTSMAMMFWYILRIFMSRD